MTYENRLYQEEMVGLVYKLDNYEVAPFRSAWWAEAEQDGLEVAVKGAWNFNLKTPVIVSGAVGVWYKGERIGLMENLSREQEVIDAVGYAYGIAKRRKRERKKERINEGLVRARSLISSK